MKNICLNGTFKIDLISHTQLPLRCWALNRFLSHTQNLTCHHLGNTSISRQTNKQTLPLGKICCCRITTKDSNFETKLKLGSFLVHNDLVVKDVAQVKHFCDTNIWTICNIPALFSHIKRSNILYRQKTFLISNNSQNRRNSFVYDDWVEKQCSKRIPFGEVFWTQNNNEGFSCGTS